MSKAVKEAHAHLASYILSPDGVHRFANNADMRQRLLSRMNDPSRQLGARLALSSRLNLALLSEVAHLELIHPEYAAEPRDLSVLQDFRNLKSLTVQVGPAVPAESIQLRLPIIKLNLTIPQGQVFAFSAGSFPRLRSLEVNLTSSSFDFQSLAQYTALEVLKLRGWGQRLDLRHLQSMTNLRTLELRHVATNDLSPLSGMTGLERLSVNCFGTTEGRGLPAQFASTQIFDSTGIPHW